MPYIVPSIALAEDSVGHSSFKFRSLMLHIYKRRSCGTACIFFPKHSEKEKKHWIIFCSYSAQFGCTTGYHKLRVVICVKTKRREMLRNVSAIQKSIHIIFRF